MANRDKVDFLYSFEQALPAEFTSAANLRSSSRPQLLAFNWDLAEKLGLKDWATAQGEGDLAQYFSGSKIIPGSRPRALAYAGHQFGHFVPQLGDGRAALLGELTGNDGKCYDGQLKGACPTPYSRRGDGLSPLGPVIREYIVSEAMYALGVPATRALAAVASGDAVYREQGPLAGGILTRVASGHIRIGTFEYAATCCRGNFTAVRQLLDYAVRRFYPQIAGRDGGGGDGDGEVALLFFQQVANAQVDLVTSWMALGFIHGVMNTDNTSISGETIDFGPCAFMDDFHIDRVFSSIDIHGRYSYQNQRQVIFWNLARLAECLIPLLYPGEEKKAVDKMSAALEHAQSQFAASLLYKFGRKLGIANPEGGDQVLIDHFLDHLQDHGKDFTLSFRHLSQELALPGSQGWEGEMGDFLPQWRQRLQQQQNYSLDEVLIRMNACNPLFIPRNHQVEHAIVCAYREDFVPFQRLCQVLKKPFEVAAESYGLERAPVASEKVRATFCGT